MILEFSTATIILLIVALVAAFVAKISARKQVEKLRKMQEDLDRINKKIEHLNSFKNDFLITLCPDIMSLMDKLVEHSARLERMEANDEQKKLLIFINSVSERLHSFISGISRLPHIDEDTAVRNSLKNLIGSRMR